MHQELKETRLAQQPSAASATREKKKKKYGKPEIIYQAPLEAMAAVCNPALGGKASGICGTAFS